MQKIIGGMFGLERGARTTDQLPPILTGRHVKLATARSAFTLLARQLGPRTAWLPSYLCDVVLGAFTLTNTPVKFYPVDDQLRLADLAWLDRVERGDMVVFIDYFGFTTWQAAGNDARARGAWVIEDACQAMLNGHFCSAAHYVVASPRKFLGVPDGGLLLAQGDSELPARELPAAPAEWWRQMLLACELRAEFDRAGGDRQWFELFRANDHAAPIEPVAMSDVTSRILLERVEYPAIIERRRENYQLLAEELGEMALFPALSPGIAPLGFPIRLDNRDAVRSRLFTQEIYPPVHWPIEQSVPAKFAASHQLAATIMTLPCDQRYEGNDMARLVTAVRSAA